MAKESENTSIQIGRRIPKLILMKRLNAVSSFRFFDNDKVGWNDWKYVQRFVTGHNISIIDFPDTAKTSWTLELRFMKKLTFNELFFEILNFV
jgi:hypothetical protein